MKLYAEVGSMRARQVATDACVVAWTGVWVWVGSRVRDVVGRLAGAGEAMERAGAGFTRPLEEAGETVAGAPVVGEALQGALEAVAGAGEALERAGAAQVDAVHNVALWLGVLLVVIPVSLLLLRYVPGRVTWVREASAAHGIRITSADLELFALRAAA